MKKKLSCFVMMVLMAISLIPATAFAAYAEDEAVYNGSVFVSLSDDGRFVISDGMISDVPMAHIEVPLDIVAGMDLKDYGLEKYSYTDYFTGEPDPDAPTVLKLYLYLLECYYGNAGDGTALRASGAPHSFFMERFWGHDCNLLYYVNGAYPLYEPGWGSTADGILLYDGDFVDVAMFTNWGFYTDKNAGFNYFVYPGSDPADCEISFGFEAETGVETEFQLIRGIGDINVGGDAIYQESVGVPVYYGSSLYCEDADFIGYTDGAGMISVTFKRPGNYCIWADGTTGTGGKPVNSAAYAEVTVLGENLEPTIEPTPTPTPTPEPTEEPTPTPTPTPEPTEEPTPTPTPEPTEEPTPTPAPTPEPTEDPTPTPTPEPTEEPTPTPTPEPTVEPTPTPTPTPEPTEDPTPTPTPEPTVEPTPTPTPEPTVEPTPTPTPTPEPTEEPTPTPTPEPTEEPTPTPTPEPTVELTPAPIVKEKLTSVELKYSELTYTGKARTQTGTAVVKAGDKVLKQGTDYTISYSNNIDAGTAKVMVKGIGDYKGTLTANFMIVPAPIKTADIRKSSYTYTGSAIKPNSSVVVTGKKNGSVTELIRGTDYKLTCQNNTKVGTATVTVTGIGNYTGTKKLSFSIVPTKASFDSVKAEKKKITLKWTKKKKEADGYQVRLSTKKDFSAGLKSYKLKIADVSGRTITKTVTGLTSGTTYYVRLRSYTTVNGRNYYSGWSEVTKVKVN